MYVINRNAEFFPDFDPIIKRIEKVLEKTLLLAYISDILFHPTFTIEFKLIMCC